MRRSDLRVVQLHVVPDRAAPIRDEDVRLALLAGLDRLPARMRAAVVLRYYADLPVKGVAEALGTSENTVKTQLREALERLRLALADDDPRTREAAHG